MPLTTRETFTPSERRRNRRSCRFSTAILNILHEMGNLAVRNAHTPVYRRSGLKREHKAPQVLEQELSTASDPPQPKLGGLRKGAQILCRTRHYTGTVQTFPATRSRKGKHALRSHEKVARKAPGLLSLRMHGDETILSSANTQANVAATNTANTTKGPCNPPTQRRVALLEHKW